MADDFLQELREMHEAASRGVQAPNVGGVRDKARRLRDEADKLDAKADLWITEELKRG